MTQTMLSIDDLLIELHKAAEPYIPKNVDINNLHTTAYMVARRVEQTPCDATISQFVTVYNVTADMINKHGGNAGRILYNG